MGKDNFTKTVLKIVADATADILVNRIKERLVMNYPFHSVKQVNELIDQEKESFKKLYSEKINDTT